VRTREKNAREPGEHFTHCEGETREDREDARGQNARPFSARERARTHARGLITGENRERMASPEIPRKQNARAPREDSSFPSEERARAKPSLTRPLSWAGQVQSADTLDKETPTGRGKPVMPRAHGMDENTICPLESRSDIQTVALLAISGECASGPQSPGGLGTIGRRHRLPRLVAAADSIVHGHWNSHSPGRAALRPPPRPPTALGQPILRPRRVRGRTTPDSPGRMLPALPWIEKPDQSSAPPPGSAPFTGAFVASCGPGVSEPRRELFSDP
jgi:hypothetical protein